MYDKWSPADRGKFGRESSEYQDMSAVVWWSQAVSVPTKMTALIYPEVLDSRAEGTLIARINRLNRVPKSMSPLRVISLFLFCFYLIMISNALFCAVMIRLQSIIPMLWTEVTVQVWTDSCFLVITGNICKLVAWIWLGIRAAKWK